MYVFMSVCLYVPSFLRQILEYGMTCVGTLKQIKHSPGWGFVRGTSVVVRRKLRNSEQRYILLLHDLRQTSTERFVKLVVESDFCSVMTSFY